MPNYRFGKGPIAVTLENLLADRDKAMQLLRQLYDENMSPNDLILADELEALFGPIERNHFNNAFGDNLPAGTPGVGGNWRSTMVPSASKSSDRASERPRCSSSVSTRKSPRTISTTRSLGTPRI